MVQYGPYVKDAKTSIQGIARRELQIYPNTKKVVQKIDGEMQKQIWLFNGEENEVI
jgi:hypothetical protein